MNGQHTAQVQYRLALGIAIAASCALAYVAPYDVHFARLTQNSGVARAIAMLFCWIAGLWLQRANGFSLGIVRMRRPVLSLVAAAIIVALWCVTLDAFVFRAVLPAGYHGFEQLPLGTRLLYYSSRAFNENILYRLFFGSLLAWLIRLVVRKPELALAMSMVGMTIAQLANVAINLGHAATSVEAVAWLILRFGIPGVAWAWLYVRHGFVANEAAAIGVHWILQPLVSIALATR